MQKEKLSTVKWGDIFYCDLGKMNGSVQCGHRPVLVIQTNSLNKSSPTMVVAVITSVRKKQSMTTHILLDKDCGLSEPSMVALLFFSKKLKKMKRRIIGIILGAIFNNNSYLSKTTSSK